jgi:hypothetical protein
MMEGLDFVNEAFKLLPIVPAVIIMFLSLFISKQMKRDEQGKLPNWFTAIPLLLGLVYGIPEYLVQHTDLFVKNAGAYPQPLWKSWILAAQEGLKYGTAAIGLWSGRRLIPFFSKVVDKVENNE